MSQTEVTDEKGRKYWVHTSQDIPAGGYIVIGPPEGLVDELGLPEPFATRLHNILYDRKIFNYKAASANGALKGALQDALSVDTQKLAEAFAKYEQETVGG